VPFYVAGRCQAPVVSIDVTRADLLLAIEVRGGDVSDVCLASSGAV